MEIIFVVLVLVALFVGWRFRKIEREKWLQDERFEESGKWLDKRAGERGTLGSLDLEMESERYQLRKSVKTHELLRQVKNYFYQHGQPLSERAEMHLKNKLERFVEYIDQISRGRMPQHLIFPKDFKPQKNNPLKTLLLEFAYQNYPKLLDLDLPDILKLDYLAENFVEESFPNLMAR